MTDWLVPEDGEGHILTERGGGAGVLAGSEGVDGGVF